MKTVSLYALWDNQCRLSHRDLMLSHKMDISMVWAVNNDNEYNEMQNTHALHTHIVGSNLITPFVVAI